LKVLLLSDINSAHTQKWVHSLSKEGIEIGVFSLRSLNTQSYENKPNIRIYVSNQFKSSGSKLNYLLALPSLKKVIREFKPDIVHSHYASSYGLLGAFSGFHPVILSMWGSDIYAFPNQNVIQKYLIKYNFKKADILLSTSKAMAQEAKKYTSKRITVVPFGIDTSIFKSKEVKNIADKGDIVVGTIKQLEKEYGHEYLLRAFSIVKKRLEHIPLKLLIVGSGSLAEQLKTLAKELEIQEGTIFAGFINPIDISEYHNMITISVFPSLQESFGVSVLEAAACEKPVVVSNVGGLPEVVEDGVTGIVIPPADPNRLADAIEKLILNEKLRTEMGKNGRERVKRLYEWNNCVEQMLSIYRQAISYK
jgi:glycosyltransferase involved in cell wall biosynthesis